LSTQETDVLVLGSGGAGLVAALVAAQSGLRVRVLERTEYVGGTTAVSAGMLWIPNNHHMAQLSIDDSREEALEYMTRIAGGQAPPALIEALVDEGAAMVRWLEETTPVRLYAIDRPDYHSEFAGAKPGGRALDNQPLDSKTLGAAADMVRPSHWYPEPYTYDEKRLGLATAALKEERLERGVWVFGRALVGGLLKACLDAGVEVSLGARAVRLLREDGRVTGAVVIDADGTDCEHRAAQGVVVATGGFEWNDSLKAAFLRGPDAGPLSPPYNEGDGLLMGMDVGAALGNLNEAAWHIAFQVPGETIDGRPRGRFISGERALPGSIIVNRRGRRIVNEASSYSDMSRVFQQFDPETYDYPNLVSYMVFDERFRQRYSFATLKPGGPTPDWVLRGETLERLAKRAGIDAAALVSEVERFNRFAADGVDRDFRRGEAVHDRHYGDASHGPNPCLGQLTQPPFYAIPVFVGALGTRGGLQTDEHARVLDNFGSVIEGLYCCSNAMACATGIGYPGAGGTLGPNLTFGHIAGRAIVAGSASAVADTGAGGR
jgi:succinate dehydrogenase/fumarate reductase flavoprotein subunit